MELRKEVKLLYEFVTGPEEAEQIRDFSIGRLNLNKALPSDLLLHPEDD